MRICVFGASSNDIDQAYIAAGEQLGREMAAVGHELIFGGGQTGLMGAVARGVKSGNGKITGVAPTFFDLPGILYQECDEFIYTETMRERKDLMDQMAEAFIMTPGGIGTMEEFFEIYTLKQLDRHSKPIGILNVNGYYDELIQMLIHTAEKGFMDMKCIDLFCVSDSPTELLAMMTENK